MAKRPSKKAQAIEKMTRGQRMIAFIEEYCKVPEGRLVGKPMVLDDFQKDFILDVYDNPAGTTNAILSIARKNGKTALIAALGLGHIVGPEAILNTQVVSGARSRDQAALVFKLMVKMIGLEPRLRPIVKIIPSGKTVFGLPRNVEYRAISAEAKTAHGLSPVVAILDESGQVRGPTDDFIDAIETSQGAHENPLLITISTQAASDADLLSLWIDDARIGTDPQRILHLHEAPKECELLDPAAWAAANPALGNFRQLEDMERLAKKASRMPSFAPTFRNLNLNQRVEAHSPFVSKEVWEENGGFAEEIEGEEVFAGLDLASVSDLCALVLVSRDGSVVPTFWLPEEGLKEKADEARAPYDVWADQGYISTTPGRAVQYEFIATHLRGLFDRCNVVALAFDRYAMRFLKPWLEKEGFSEEELERFIDFGQGFVSMSPALRELEARLLAGKLKHGNNPVLTMCAANAAVLKDPAGNRKFAKNKSTGRIDGMVALAMAVGSMPSEVEEEDLDGFINAPVRMRYA